MWKDVVKDYICVGGKDIFCYFCIDCGMCCYRYCLVIYLMDCNVFKFERFRRFSFF